MPRIIILVLSSLIAPVSPLRATEIFVIGVEDNRYPPHFFIENGEYAGFARQVLDAFFEVYDIPFEYRPLPVTRLFQSFVDGQLDFKYPDNFLWHPEMKMNLAIQYSDPIVSFIDGISVPPHSIGRTIETFHLIGTVRGFTRPSWSGNQLQFLENDSFQGIVEQALIGRVEGVYANIDVVSYLLENVVKRPDELVFDASLPYVSGHYRLSSIKHPDVIRAFNVWMQSNQMFLQALKAQYRLEQQRTRY